MTKDIITITVPPLVVEVIKAGIEVTLSTDIAYGLVYDLNLQAKSHTYLYMLDGKQMVVMRYDPHIEVETLQDLLAAAYAGMHGNGGFPV